MSLDSVSCFYYKVMVRLGTRYNIKDYTYDIHLYKHISDDEIKEYIRGHMISKGDEEGLARLNDRFVVITYARHKCKEHSKSYKSTFFAILKQMWVYRSKRR